MATKKVTEPIKVEIVNIDEIRTAVYEGILMANYMDDTDKWDIVSKIKFKAKGWAAIAESWLESEREQQGGDWEITKKDIARKAREIQRKVEVRRQYPFGTDIEEEKVENNDDWLAGE